MKRLSAFVLATLVASTANAQMMTGATLQQQLTAAQRIQQRQGNSDDYGQGMAAMGYIDGVVDSFSGKYFCLPPGATRFEMDAVVLKFLNEHPDFWHYTASAVTTEALKVSFPCKTP
jgi:hypothetical protein